MIVLCYLKWLKASQEKLIGDKGYISQDLFNRLYEKGLQLITKIRKNMKNKLMPIIDKIFCRS